MRGINYERLQQCLLSELSLTHISQAIILSEFAARALSINDQPFAANDVYDHRQRREYPSAPSNDTDTQQIISTSPTPVSLLISSCWLALQHGSLWDSMQAHSIQVQYLFQSRSSSQNVYIQTIQKEMTQCQ